MEAQTGPLTSFMMVLLDLATFLLVCFFFFWPFQERLVKLLKFLLINFNFFLSQTAFQTEFNWHVSNVVGQEEEHSIVEKVQ